MKSAALIPFLFTGLITYGHKLSFISKVITLLAAWYGRTTWWKLLIKVRKLFVIFNALIGVYMVFKTVGFNTDNILAGFTALGHQYFEILTSFTKRLFNWFFDLFDHKVVPNPSSKPSIPFNKGGFSIYHPFNNLGWYTKPMNSDPLTKIMELAKTQDFYNSPIKLSVTTNSLDNSTWLWYSFVGLCGIGLLVLGYKFITDPTIFNRFFSNNSGSVSDAGTPSDITITPDMTITDNRGVVDTVSNLTKRILNSLNPFNYITTSAELNRQHLNFMERQYNNVTADYKYYPFTNIKPYSPWYSKLKLVFFGETPIESLDRFKERTYAERVINSLTLTNGKAVDIGAVTPSVVVGIGINTPSFSLIDAIHNNNVANKLNSIPSTPKLVPTIPTFELQEVEGWNTHVKESIDVATSSIVTLDDLADDNKFSYLDETII